MEAENKPDLIDDPDTLTKRVTALEREVARLKAQVEILTDRMDRVKPLELA